MRLRENVWSNPRSGSPGGLGDRSPHLSGRVVRARARLGSHDIDRDRKRNRHPPLHMMLFALGDAGFLALAGVMTTLTMWSVHQTDWPFVCASLLGMVAAMLVQVILSWCVTPLLGSIESMVPSMVLAMVSPMSMCVLHMLGCELTWRHAAMLGTAWGLVLFALLQVYGLGVRRSLRQTHETR